MSDQTSTLVIKLLSQGDLSALAHGKDQSEALKVSVEGLKLALETLGVGLSFGALLEGSKAMVEYGAQIEHLSAQAGITTDAFQNLSYAAIGAGLHAEDLSQAFSVLQRNMAQAADGATKQNHAIADLGLSTAELLTMSGEQQIEAIAHAYVNAADKTKAWADVVALLGRNSAHVKELLQDIGANGLKDNPFKISEADIERLEHTERFWATLWAEVKSVTGTAVARPLDAMLAGSPAGGSGLGGLMAGGFTAPKAGESEKKETPEEHAARVAAAQAELEATIQGTPQMVAAHAALTKALNDLNAANETRAESAERLRKEAYSDWQQAVELEKNKTDATAQLEAVKLRTEAAKLSAQAVKEDATAKKEAAKADFDFQKADAELQAQLAKGNERQQVQRIEQAQREQENQTRRESIALAAIEHDANVTEAKKWQEKRDLLAAIVVEQEAYIGRMADMADDPSLSHEARAKAGSAADKGITALAGTKAAQAEQGADPHSIGQNLSTEFTKLQNQWGTFEQSVGRGATSVIGTAFNTIGSNVSKLVMGTQTLGQAFRNIALDIETSFVQAIITAGETWITQEAMKLAFGATAKATDTATSLAAAEAASMMWAVPAALASVASYGAADLAGMAGLSAAVTEAVAIGSAGFEDGGYTGGMEGQAAGIVHGQEFVWSAPAVRAVGLGNLDRAHQAALGGARGAAPVPASGAPGSIIVAMSPEDVARSQRAHVDARVMRATTRLNVARVAL